MRTDLQQAIEGGALISTAELMAGVTEPTHVQKDVAALYAVAIRCDVGITDWPTVNRAIIDRWSLAALKRIKELAWKAAEPA